MIRSGFSSLLCIAALLGCTSTFSYPEPSDPTPEFYQVKALCQREAHGDGKAPFVDQREYFITCMKGHGY